MLELFAYDNVCPFWLSIKYEIVGSGCPVSVSASASVSVSVSMLGIKCEILLRDSSDEIVLSALPRTSYLHVYHLT